MVQLAARMLGFPMSAKHERQDAVHHWRRSAVLDGSQPIDAAVTSRGLHGDRLELVYRNPRSDRAVAPRWPLPGSSRHPVVLGCPQNKVYEGSGTGFLQLGDRGLDAGTQIGKSLSIDRQPGGQGPNYGVNPFPESIPCLLAAAVNASVPNPNASPT